VNLGFNGKGVPTQPKERRLACQRCVGEGERSRQNLKSTAESRRSLIIR
jgi:hypothetical protein